MDEAVELLIEQLPRARRTLRIAIVTETYPPDANDVALAAACVVEGLRQREHEIQLVRPRRHRGDGASGAAKLEEVLTRGMPILRHPDLKFGLPATRALAHLWRRSRPDVVHILTQGPLGWSALRAARQLKVPVVSDFNAGLPYGAGWLGRPILAYLRKFHNRALWTFASTETLCAELAALGFRNVRVLARGGDAAPRLAVEPLETLLEIAAGIGAASRIAPDERGARVPLPQGT
jgi:Glycosyltransferase Family 4